jgi:hypothetical protein
VLDILNQPIELSPATILVMTYIAIGILAIVIAVAIATEAIRQWWDF